MTHWPSCPSPPARPVAGQPAAMHARGGGRVGGKRRRPDEPAKQAAAGTHPTTSTGTRDVRGPRRRRVDEDIEFDFDSGEEDDNVNAAGAHDAAAHGSGEGADGEDDGEDADAKRVRLAKAVLARVKGMGRSGDGADSAHGVTGTEGVDDDGEGDGEGEGDAMDGTEVSRRLTRHLLSSTGRLVRCVGAWLSSPTGASPLTPPPTATFRRGHEVSSGCA